MRGGGLPSVLAVGPPTPSGWPGALPRPAGAADDTQLREILGTLHRRWRVVAGFAAAGLAVMAIASLLVERRWTATAMLHVKNQPPHVTNIQQVVTPPSYLEGVEFFQDQVKFLESRSLAARVIRDQGLEGDPVFTEEDQPGALGRAARAVASAVLWPLSWLRSGDETPAEPPVEPVLGVAPRLIARYARGLEVQPITNSRLIEVRFTSPSAGLSQRIANAHARGYIVKEPRVEVPAHRRGAHLSAGGDRSRAA